MPDNVGNTPNTALDISLAPVVKTFTDSVSSGNIDYYRFTLLERSSFGASLTDLNANANVELLNSLGNTLSVNGVPQSSLNEGTLLDIVTTVLDPGTYYIRVSPGSPTDPANAASTTPNTSYNLNVLADNDVKSNILWRDYATGENFLWQMSGTATTAVSNLTPMFDLNWRIQAAADLNNDENTDIFWRNYATGQVGVWLMNGNAISEAKSITYVTDLNWQLVGVGSFSNVSETALVWRNYATGENGLWIMDGTSIVDYFLLTSAPTEWAIQGVDDFTGDGNSDFVWRNRRTGENGIWVLDKTELSVAIPLSNVTDQNRQIQGTGDFDRDGQTDILWRNFADGSNEAWLMDGTVVKAIVPLQAQPNLNWVATAPFASFPNPTEFDTAANRRQDGLFIGALNGNGVYSEEINPTDGEDYYKFLLGSTTDLVATLSGPTGGNLAADLDFQILDAAGAVVGSSTQSGSTRETVTSPFNAGTYYIRVFPKNPVTVSVPYTLDLKVNNRPVLATNSPLTLNEGATKTIDRSTLLITDENNTANQLTYALSASPNSARGDLLFDGNRITTGNRFTQADIDSGKLSYRQNGSETTTDNFVFTVSDGQGGSISATTFSINVTPVNDAPVLTTNVSLTLSEGAVANLSSSNLALTDAEQSTAQLVYTVGDLPTKGSLSLNGALVTKGTTFTQADINSGNKLSYRHDGSESLSDSFTFSAGDGAGGTLTPPVNTFSLQITPINDLPVLVTNQGVVVPQGDYKIITTNTLRTTDAELLPPPDALLNQITYSIAAAPESGTLYLNDTPFVTRFTQADIDNQRIAYKHNGGNSNSDSFKFSVSDGIASTTLSTFYITVSRENAVPVLTTNLGLTLNEGAAQAITPSELQVTDRDGGSAQIFYTLTDLPDNGMLEQQGAPLTLGARFTQFDLNDSPSRIAYRHNGSETLQDSFQFTVSDSAGGAISTRTFDIKVNPVNDPPRLISLGSLSVTESDTAITSIGKALLQAIDPDPNTQITYTVLSAPTGTLLLDSTPVTTFTQADIDAGRLKYRQGGSEAASDSFSFSITDGTTELIGPSVFNISVTPSNDAPQIVLNDRLTLNESGTQSITDGLLLVTDVDGPGPVTYTLNGAPTKGQLKLGDQALSSNQTFTQDDITGNRISYTHDGSESTADSFSFRASDGSTGTLPLTTFNIRVNSVNDAPIVTVPGAQTIDEDTSLTFGTGRLISITDVDAGDSPLFVELRVNNGKLTVNTPSTIVTGNGTNRVILQGAQGRISTILNGGIKYDPDKEFNGLDVLTVRADDQGSSGDDGQQQFTLKTIDIAVRAINDSPTLRLTSSATTVREDEVLNLAFSTTDVDAGDSFVKATLVATNGTLTVASSNIGFLDGTSNGGRTVTFTGTIADITNALSSVDYQGVRNYNGTDTISVTIDDQGSTGANGRPTLLTIPVTVTAVNDAPSFTAGTSQTVNERDDSGVIRVANWATAISRGGGADEAAQTLAFDVTTDSSNLFTSNGRPVINASTGELSYTLAPNAFGTANVTVVLRDSGSGTAPNVNLSAPSIFTIGVNPVNDAPTFTRRASTATIDEDAPAQTLWWATGISAGPATPTPNGVPNEATTQTVEFVIDNSNPNLFETGPTIAPNGTLTYKTAQDANGTAILTVRLRDDGGTENGGVNVSGPQTYTINVRSVNDAPLLAIPTTLDTEEDTSLDITGLSITDVDAGDGPLRVTLTALGMGTSGTSGTLGVAATQGVTILTGSNGSNLQLTGKLNDLNTALSSLKYQGKLNVSGTERISVSVTDNGNTGTIGGTKTATGTFSVNVAAVNDAPTVTISTANRSVQEDLNALLSGIGVTDVDAGSTGVVEVTVSALQGTLTLPTAGLTISANGTNSVTARGVLSILNSALANLRYTSNLNYNGPDEITVTIDDQGLSGIGGAQRDSKSFSLNITPVNDLPQLTMPTGPLSVNEDEALTFTGAAAIALTDVDSGSNPIQVTLAVNSGSLALTDTGLRLITSTSNPSGGQRSLTYEGTIDSIRTALETLIYRGNPNAFGSDNLTVTVNDRGKTGATSGTDVTRSVSITVASVNDVPVLVTNRSLSLLEGTTKLISSGLLNTTDADSPPQSSLVYTIDTAPTTTNSRLILRNGTTVTTLGAGSTFTQADITGNRLSYMHGGGEDSSDSFVFRVSDGSGGTIDSTTFNISVTPSNDTPLVTTNASLTVMEGDTLNILPSFLQATDADNRPSELRYTLTSALSSGTLLLNGGSLSVNQTFTQEDIDFGRLAYSHSGSETTRDSFSFALSDGSSGSTGTFNIAVTPVNDPVTLASNNPLTVNEGATTNITKGLLQAIDPDTPLSEIRYTLTAAPLRGTLRLNNNPLAAGGTFTEQDIQSGLLSYQHLGGEQTDDTFFFRVSSTGNDLQLDDRFVIRVNPLNDAPVLVRNTGISIRGDSSSVTTIGRGALLTTDVDNTERQLVYTLRSLPDVTVGELRLDNRVLKVGDTFTQEDIGAGKVKYAYFRNGAGDGFEFSVSDGATGGTLSNAFFDITYNYS